LPEPRQRLAADPGSEGRDPEDDRGGCQVDEQVAAVLEDDDLVESDAMVGRQPRRGFERRQPGFGGRVLVDDHGGASLRAKEPVRLLARRPLHSRTNVRRVDGVQPSGGPSSLLPGRSPETGHGTGTRLPPSRRIVVSMNVTSYSMT
jgi:hypothetical protein